MKRFFYLAALTACVLSLLSACGGSSAPFGNVPDIVNDAIQQYEEFKKEAKQTKDKSEKSFEKMMKKEMKLWTNTANKVKKESNRIQGRTIPCVGGDAAYDFMKINKVVIDTVRFERQTALVHLSFIPDAKGTTLSRENKIYFVFLDKDGKKIQKGYTDAVYLTEIVPVGKLSSVPPERWNDMKEIRFLTAEEANQF